MQVHTPDSIKPFDFDAAMPANFRAVVQSSDGGDQPASRILEDRPTGFQIIEMSPGEEIDLAEETVRQQFDGKVLLTITSNIGINSSRLNTVLPGGYPISISDLSGDAPSIKLSAAGEPAMIMAVPTEEFRSWRQRNSWLSARLVQVIQQVHPASRTSPEVRDQIQDIRSRNISTLVGHKAMDFINREDGLLKVLNPKQVEYSVKGDLGRPDRIVGTVEQSWNLLDMLAPILHFNNYTEVEKLARMSRRIAKRLFPEDEASVVTVAYTILSEYLKGEQRRLFSRLYPRIDDLLGFRPDATVAEKVASR